MANFLKRIFVKNIDNVDNQEYFTEGLKKAHQDLDSTLFIDDDRQLTVRKKVEAKKGAETSKENKPKDDLFLDDKEEEKKEPVPSPTIKVDKKKKVVEEAPPIKKPVVPIEEKKIEINTEAKTEPPTTVTKEQKPVVNLQLNESVRMVEQPIKQVKDDPNKPKIEVVKEVKELGKTLNDSKIKETFPIEINTKDIEKRISELEDLVYDYSDKIYKSEDKKEIDYYIKELYKIIEEINSLLKKLDDGKELVKIDELKVSNKEEFLANYEKLSTKLVKLQKEYVEKEIDAANIKRDLVEDDDKEKDKKMLEVDRQAKEVEYFQKKIDNDLYYMFHLKSRIEEITETRQRVERTYVGVQRAMNNLVRGLALATLLPGPVRLLAIVGAHIGATIRLATEMVNPTYVERAYQENVVTEEIIETTRTIDDSDIYKAEKDLDEIIKDFDYLMKECYKLFNENPKYKDLFDELKEIKSVLDYQKQELIDLQKTSSKQLVLQKEPIKE